MILAVAGPRPQKVGGYTEEARLRLVAFAKEHLNDFVRWTGGVFLAGGIDNVLTGMALGWDQAVADACVELGIPFTAVVPCVGQQNKWSRKYKTHYEELLTKAANVVTVSEGEYTPQKMRERNRYLAMNCNFMSALYDGSGGGTGHCVNMGKYYGVRMHNCWQDWLDFNDFLGGDNAAS